MARSSSSSRARYLAWLLPPLAVVALTTGLLAQAAPNIQVLDGATNIPNGTGTVAFNSTAPGVAVTKTFTVRNTGTANLLVGENISVPEGFTLMAYFPGTPNALFGPNNNPASQPAYTIAPNATATFMVALNSITPGDKMGVVSISTNVAGANPFTFNVTGTITGSTGGGGNGPNLVVIDDGGPNYTATSGWIGGFDGPGTSGRFPVQGDVSYIPPGTGSEVATYSFTGLTAGTTYRVQGSWAGYNGAATNTPYRIYNNGTLVRTVRVDQTIDSVGTPDGGGFWQLLDTVTLTGTTLTVTVADDANGYPTTDAFRIEKVGGSIPKTIDDGDPNYTATSGWIGGFDGPGTSGRFPFGGDVSYIPPGTGSEVATYTFTGLTAGQYRVLGSWAGYAGAATNTPYRIYNGAATGTPLSTVRVNQLNDSVGTPDGGGFWQLLDTVTITGTTLTVTVADDANGYPTTDAFRVEQANGGGTPNVTDADAARLLGQLGWGPTPAGITAVKSTGIAAYVDAQFGLPVSGYPALPLYNVNDNQIIGGVPNRTTSCYVPGTPTADETNARNACLRDNYDRNAWLHPLQTRFFTNAIYGDDQLRQRMAWRLHQIWVVSAVDTRQPSWMAPYLKITVDNAFGNFRTLMYQMTLNPAMGAYLDMAGSNRLAPNENYPRELLQLFTIGTEELNPDGSRKMNGSNEPIPTYDQPLIIQISKVYTGWNLAPAIAAGTPDYISPMRLGGAATENPANHDFTAKVLLRGYVQPARTASVANAYLDLNESLDNIYNHPSLAPYICKQLIQSLVTGTPSPAYVARVVDVFNRNKTSNTQLQQVARAILLDPEARDPVRAAADNYGHLKEPALFITNLMRLFDAKSADRTQNSEGFLNDTALLSSDLGQSVFRPPSVFSYFPPDKVVHPGPPPVIGPEFGILTTSTALRRVNFVNLAFAPASTRVIDVVRTPLNTPTGIYPAGYPLAGQPIVGDYPRGTSVDISPLMPLATDVPALLNELNRLMLNGTMTAEFRAQVETAVNAVTVSATPTDAQRRKRARTAVYLIATSGRYQVQK